MVGRFQVHSEIHNKWPARNGKPAGENFSLLLIDMSRSDNPRLENPCACRLRAMYEFRLDDDVRSKWWGRATDETLEIGVQVIASGDNGKPYMRGVILNDPPLIEVARGSQAAAVVGGKAAK